MMVHVCKIVKQFKVLILVQELARQEVLRFELSPLKAFVLKVVISLNLFCRQINCKEKHLLAELDYWFICMHSFFLFWQSNHLHTRSYNRQPYSSHFNRDSCFASSSWGSPDSASNGLNSGKMGHLTVIWKLNLVSRRPSCNDMRSKQAWVAVALLQPLCCCHNFQFTDINSCQWTPSLPR